MKAFLLKSVHVVKKVGYVRCMRWPSYYIDFVPKTLKVNTSAANLSLPVS